MQDFFAIILHFFDAFFVVFVCCFPLRFAGFCLVRVSCFYFPPVAFPLSCPVPPFLIWRVLAVAVACGSPWRVYGGLRR